MAPFPVGLDAAPAQQRARATPRRRPMRRALTERAVSGLNPRTGATLVLWDFDIRPAGGNQNAGARCGPGGSPPSEESQQR